MRRFQDIRDNGWNGEVCTLGSGSTDVIGAGCRNCGHTNMLHPQPFANPALSECVICRLFKTIEEMKTSGGQQ